MIICFRIGGQEHSYEIPAVEIPLPVYRPVARDVNYAAFFYDAILVASLEAATKKVTDAGVRNALQGGINAAKMALKARGGAHVTNIKTE